MRCDSGTFSSSESDVARTTMRYSQILSPGDALGAWLRAFRNLQIDSCAKSACSQLNGRFLACRGQLGLVSSCVDVCQRLSMCVIACRSVSYGLRITHGLRISADCRLETDCRITDYSKRGNYSEVSRLSRVRCQRMP